MEPELRSSTAQQELIADMKQRELHLKSRLRATDSILYELRRYRVVLVGLVVVVVATVAGLVDRAVIITMPDERGWQLPVGTVAVMAGLLGIPCGQGLLRTKVGQRLLARKESRLRDKYSEDLHSGRRWLQFYYRGEDISAYVPQILYFLEADPRFDTVDAALAFVKERRRDSPAQAAFAAQALRQFEDVAAQVNQLIMSSSDDAGRPSSRFMRFVKTDRPGVWYVTTAPEGPKVPELDRGQVAVLTSPTPAGATISSNRVHISRAPHPFPAIADLYRTQVPGYMDGMTDEEKDRELVYEVRLRSARVETWLRHDEVAFDGPEADDLPRSTHVPGEGM
jgi:hypothetical protein